MTKVGVVNTKTGLVTKRDKSKKVSFVKSGAKIHEGDILELISGAASLNMLYGGSLELSPGTPIEFAEGFESPEALLSQPPKSNEDKLITKDLGNALINSVLEKSRVSSYLVEQGLSSLSKSLLDEPLEIEPEDPVKIDAILTGIIENSNKSYSSYIQAIPKETMVMKQKATLERTTIIDKTTEKNQAMDNLLVEEELFNIISHSLQAPLQEVRFYTPLVHLQSQKKSPIIANLAEIRASHILQVNVASVGFLEGDQLVLQNSNRLYFDINSNEVSIDSRICMQFNLTQNRHDISYDFSGIGNKLLAKPLYERILQAIYFSPSPDEHHINTPRNISVQIIDDTGMAFHIVVQCQVELAK